MYACVKKQNVKQVQTKDLSNKREHFVTVYVLWALRLHTVCEFELLVYLVTINRLILSFVSTSQRTEGLKIKLWPDV